MIKVIKRWTDNVVLFVGNDLVLNEIGCSGVGWSFRNIDPNELVLDEAAEIPEGFVGGGWAYANGVWTINSIGEQALLPAKRAAKIAELESARLAFDYSVIAHAGQTWKADSDARALLAQVLAVGSVPHNAYWRDAAGAKHAMTYAGLQALAQAIAARAYAADEMLEGKKAAVAQAATASEIDSIIW